MGSESPSTLNFGSTLELLETVLNLDLAFICVKDRESRFVYLTEAHAALFNSTPEEMIGQTVESWVGHKQYLKWYHEDLAIIESGKKKEYEVYPRVGKNHVTLWFQSVKIPFRDKVQGRDLLLIVHRDVSSIKKSDQERELLRQQMLASQKMETIGLLAGNVAHDFNSLLTTIMGSARMLSHDKNLSPESGFLVDSITKSAERASEVVSRLLILGRKEPVVHCQLDVNQRILEIKPLLESMVGDRITLTFELQKKPSLINGNGALIQEALVNLLLNSKQALPLGGHISVKTTQEERPDGKAEVLLEIKDNGVGMDEKTRQKAFEPFFTTKAVGQGTGLGLMVVQRIVEQHGGRVQLQSAPGIGTSIILHFPITASVSPAVAEQSARNWKGKTVLVAEDEKLLRLLISKSLTALGIKVLQAENGDMAWQIFQQFSGQIDCLISDVVMPGGMDGVTLRRMVYEERKEIPSILMSGYTFDYHSSQDILPPLTEFLPKPYSLESLHQKLFALLV